MDQTNIKIRLYGSLYRYGKEDSWFDLELGARSTLEDLLPALDLPASSVSFITVNGRKQQLTYELKSFDEVRIFPRVTGG